MFTDKIGAMPPNHRLAGGSGRAQIGVMNGTVNTAAERGVDLILIAAHGHTGLKHAFLGGTTERVVQHASRPVLVVCE